MAIKKITVLHGGQSSEREVSLESGKYIFQSLKELGYDTQLVDYPANFLISEFTPEDYIFIALHGEDGESGELQKFLEEKGIPYSGSDYMACKNTWNKDLCKKLMRENNIPTPVLENVWNRNITIDRKEQDWKKLIGRAVSKKDEK